MENNLKDEIERLEKQVEEIGEKVDSNLNTPIDKTFKLFKEIGEWAICIFVALIIALSIKYFLGTFTTVKQLSMDPTLKQNDRLWLNRTIRTFKGEYKVGDIATFEAPNIDTIDVVSNKNPKAIYEERKNFAEKFIKNFLEIGKISYIKRVIAVEGDHVKIEDGIVFVNGEALREEYLETGTYTNSSNLTDFIVPENSLFLMGDNRKNSTDSRAFGCIPLEKMEGRIALRILPFNKFGKISNTYEENL